MIKNLIIGILLFSSLQGEITEIQGIESVKSYIQNDTVVLLNVGDTLFAPSSMLADYKFRQYFVEKVNGLLGDSPAAPAIIDLVKGIIVEKIPKVTPEKVTSIFVENLQNGKVPVLGYTERFFSNSYAPNNGKITSQQLLNIGIDLEKTLSYFPVKAYHNDKFDFQYGMIFGNKNNIGPALVDFFQTQGFTPAHVILVDDHVETLKDIEQALSLLNVDFQGLRYGQGDERKKHFDSTLATIEFFAYMTENKLMTDEEALQERTKNPNVNWEEQLNAWIMSQERLAGH